MSYVFSGSFILGVYLAVSVVPWAGIAGAGPVFPVGDSLYRPVLPEVGQGLLRLFGHCQAIRDTSYRVGLAGDVFCAARNAGIFIWRLSFMGVVHIFSNHGPEHEVSARIFLNTDFEGGRHSQRVDKIKAMEG